MALNSRVHSGIAGTHLEHARPNAVTSVVWKSNSRRNCAVYKKEPYTEP